MKFPKTITLTKVELEGSSEPKRGVFHLDKQHTVEYTARLFVKTLRSMDDVVVPPKVAGGLWDCVVIDLIVETIHVRETREEIRAMIEALPNEDEPEQSKPTGEGRFLCQECSAEFGQEEVPSDGYLRLCPSCGGRLTVMMPNTDA